MQKKADSFDKFLFKNIGQHAIIVYFDCLTLYLAEHAKKSVCRFEISFPETPCDFVLCVAMAG